MQLVNLIAQTKQPPEILGLIIGITLVLAAIVSGIKILQTWFNRHFPKITIYDYQAGVHYRNGIFKELLKPGTYRFAESKSTITPFDMREQSIQIAGQEVLTADALGFKLSLIGSYRVNDPLKACNVVEHYYSALYTDIQTACRSVIEQMTCEEILAARHTLGERIFEIAASQTGRYGVELLSLSIRDYMLPGPLKAIYAKVAEAKQEALAALERARGETAALRSLANASRVMSSNPGLGLLRTLQTLEKSTGNTLVMLPPELAARLPEKLLETSGGEKQPTDKESQAGS